MLSYLGQTTLGRAQEQSAEGSVTGEKGLSIEWHLKAREKGRGIHVVLNKCVCDHNIPNLDVSPQCACNAAEDHMGDAKVMNQGAHRGRGRHLADSTEHRHHLHAMPGGLPKLSPTQGFHVGLQARHNATQLLMQGADHAQTKLRCPKRNRLQSLQGRWSLFHDLQEKN